MSISEELEWRGFVNQTTYPDLKVLDDKKVTFYHGFDASADSQTVGNLAGMMLDRLFMRHGHKAVILAGGATSLIGDPGGKDEERPLQDEQTITSNVAKAQEQLEKIFSDFEFKLVNNLDWTRDLKVLDFLRDYGKHFSMTTLIQRDYIAKRLGEGSAGISYAEFSYTILQGMDFLHLFDSEGVTLQLGGSDQWGNCLSGVELIRKTRGKESHVITLPLIINRATGKKFGKSEGGAVWLDPSKTSVYQFYQFWLNVDDESVEEYLKIFTELDKENIEGILSEFNQNRAGRAAQRVLAYEVTELVHGESEAQKQQHIADSLFGGGRDFLSNSDLEELKNELPVLKISDNDALNVVVAKAGLASSNSEANRLIAEGGIYLNNQRLDVNEKVQFRSGANLLRRGKNQVAIVIK